MIYIVSDKAMPKTTKTETDARGGLTQAVFHILLALADAPKHGYAIMQEVDEREDANYRLWPATLYTAIKRMLADGLIEETRAPSRPAGVDARRRFYRLTRRGRAELTAEAARLDALLDVARAKKVLPAG